MRSFVLVSAFALVIPLSGAFADNPAPAPTVTAATPQTNDPDQVICRTGPPPIGSRIGATRECHTQREWDRMHEEQRHVIETHQTVIGGGSGQ